MWNFFDCGDIMTRGDIKTRQGRVIMSPHDAHLKSISMAWKYQKMLHNWLKKQLHP